MTKGKAMSLYNRIRYEVSPMHKAAVDIAFGALREQLVASATREVCRFCGAEKCIGADICPSIQEIQEWERRVTDAEE